MTGEREKNGDETKDVVDVVDSPFPSALCLAPPSGTSEHYRTVPRACGGSWRSSWRIQKARILVAFDKRETE